MFRSITAKLVMGNLIGVLAAIGVFTAIQATQIQSNSNRILDQILTERLQRLTRGPGRGPERMEGIPNGQMGLGGPGNPNGPGAPGMGIEQGPNGMGPQARRGPPRDPMPRNARILNLEGKVEWPDSESEPIHSEEFKKTLAEGKSIADIEVDGIPMRILTQTFKTPDGRELVGQVSLENNAPNLIRDAWRNALIVLVPAALIVAGMVAWLVSRFVLRPVKAVAMTAEAVALDPDSGARVPNVGDDEIGRMAIAMNTMVDTIQASKSEVRESLENQRRFSSDAAHELRTPLAAIRLNAENALHAKATEAERIDALQDIARLGAHMTRLTDMLLTLARIDRQKTLLPSETVDIASAIRDAVRLAGGEADPRIQVDLKATSIAANRDAVIQVLRNLIENARAYAGQDGVITVTASNNHLAVHNTGEPIPAESLPHLFDRFYRVDSSRNRETGGYGLGLSIVQSLAHSMGFEARVDSNLADGTTFFVDFSPSTAN